MKVYIAGPMRGYAEYNFPAFMEAEKDLLARGHEVVNPARTDLENGFDPTRSLEEQGSPTIKDFMRRDIPLVLECDALYLLAGWEDSEGAKIERHIAFAVGMPILYAPDATRDPVATRILQGRRLKMLNG